MGKLNFSSKQGEDKPWEKLGIKLELKRNGSDLNFEVGEFLTCVSKAAEAVQSFRNGLSSAIQGEASIGLTMSGELNLLTVSLNADWARKENAGPRIPWDVNVSL
jgi:hypothetical protein